MPASHIDKLLRHLEFLRLCVNMHKSILAPSQSNVSGSVLRLKAVEMRAWPPVCLPCAFSNWTVYYTCARCSFGWNLESLGRRGLRALRIFGRSWNCGMYWFAPTNMSVVSYINHQGGVRSIKHAANLLLCADRHFLSIRAAYIPSLLNHRADMLSRKGIPQGEWRLHPESVRMIWTRYGAAEVDLFAKSSRMHIACCSSPCLTPRWRGTRWHRTGQQPGCIKNKNK